MRTLFFVCAVLLLSASGLAECPTADLSGDCFVGLADLAVLTGQWEGEPNMPLLYDMASQWLTEGIQEIVLVDIPAGTFQMGDSFDEGEYYEQPVHTVTLSSFKMSKYKITNQQYCDYLNDAYPAEIKVAGGIVYAASDDPNSYPYCDMHSYRPYSQIDFSGGVFTVSSKGGRNMINDPVGHVTWYGSKAFCDYYGYRLPSEAEWEYAARGGLAGKRFPWGDTINHNYANYIANGSAYTYDTSPYTTDTYHPTWNDGIYPYTSPVGSFSINGYGLHDMAGNVCERCNDWFSTYFFNPQTNPTGPATGNFRIIRGGDWFGDAIYCRVAFRGWNYPSDRYSFIGFRPAMDLN